MADNVDIIDGNLLATKIASTEAAGVHTIKHIVVTSALPTGAATSALQVTALAIDTALRATALPVSGTVIANAGTGTQAVSLAALPTLAAVTNLATIGTSIVPGTAATHLGKARDAAAGATDTGVAPLLIRRDAPTALTPVAGEYDVPQLDGSGSQWVHPTMGATGGATPYLLISAATTNATNVKASAGTITSIVATNNHATNIAYLKLYNLNSAPTVGTTTPVAVYTLQPLGGGVAIAFPSGMALVSGIALAITAGMATADTAAVAVSQVAVNLTYH